MKELRENNQKKNKKNHDVIPFEKQNKTIRNRRYLYNPLLFSIMKC